MNKAELVEAISTQAKTTKRDAQNVLDALINTVQTAVQNGDTVSLVGFGSFSPRKRAPRVARNLQTGETLNVPARTVPVFKAGKKFKDAVNI